MDGYRAMKTAQYLSGQYRSSWCPVLYGLSLVTAPGASGYLACSVVYIVSLSLLGGLEGFFAAKKTTGYY